MSLALSRCPSHSLSLMVAKVRKAQREREGGELEERERGGSKQIAVLPGRPPSKVCLGLEGMKEGRRGRTVGRVV